MRMKDKCGIVTAAGSGMGRAGAVRFAREGAAVAVVAIDADAVQAVVGEIESGGGRAVGIPADLTRDEDSRRIVREAASTLGGIDVVWNHVGHPGPASGEGIEMEDFDTAVTLNMRTVLVTTDAAIPEIRARGGGALLYTASTSGLRASSFSPVYSAVKHETRVAAIASGPGPTRSWRSSARTAPRETSSTNARTTPKRRFRSTGSSIRRRRPSQSSRWETPDTSRTACTSEATVQAPPLFRGSR